MVEFFIQEEVLKLFKLFVVVIDFGIVYLGYVYLFKYEWIKVKINNWGGGENFFYKIFSVFFFNLDQFFNLFGY